MTADQLAATSDAALADIRRDNDAALRKQCVDHHVTAQTAEILCDVIQHMTTPDLLHLTEMLKQNDHCEIGRVVAEAYDRWEK